MEISKYFSYIICWYIFIYFGGGFVSASESERSAKMESKIYLVPVGGIKRWILDTLDEQLKKTFKCKVEIHEGMELPQEAYNQNRNQYLSSYILKKLHSFIKPGKQEKALGIANEDLYVKGLNFVFGEAELGGRFAIISLARLHQSFYDLPENETIFTKRTVKEAVHEIGHAFGFGHCPDPDCVMHFSNTLGDTDRKSASFCSRCEQSLEKISTCR